VLIYISLSVDLEDLLPLVVDIALMDDAVPLGRLIEEISGLFRILQRHYVSQSGTSLTKQILLNLNLDVRLSARRVALAN
jgi:hypothetical protein